LIKIIIMTLATVSLLFIANSCEESLGLEDNVLFDTLNPNHKVIKRDTVILTLQDSAVIGNTVVVVDTAIVYQITELRKQNDSLYEVIDSVIKSIDKPYLPPVKGIITGWDFKLVYKTTFKEDNVINEVDVIDSITLYSKDKIDPKCMIDKNSLLPRVYIQANFLSESMIEKSKLNIHEMSLTTDTNEITQTHYANRRRNDSEQGNLYSYFLKFDGNWYSLDKDVETKFYYGEFTLTPEGQGTVRYFTGKLFIESKINYKDEDILLQGFIGFKFVY